MNAGPVKKIVEIPQLDQCDGPAFQPALRLDHINSVRMLNKPTDDGLVHSIEVFDAAGELIVQLFGKRKPGSPELSARSAFADGLQ